MKFDIQLSAVMIGLIICCLVFPFLPMLQLPLWDGALVTAVESIQAGLLLGFALFTVFMMRPYALCAQHKQFWLWSVAWWLMLFGRSTSWGRDYFPDVPKVYFRAISVCMIAPVLFMLGSGTLRQAIHEKFKTATLSLWSVLLVLLGLAVSDGIEHGRAWASLLLQQSDYKDLLEELFEFPLIIGLFLISYQLLRVDLKTAAKKVP